jgi:CRP-like cAMP-binding protein
MPGKLPRLETRNYILNTLPDEDYKRLHPGLEEIDLPRGKNIYRPDEPIKYVYFPNSSMISIVTNTSSGESIEAGIIGWEGISGIEVLMGVDSTPNNESMVQIANGAARIKTELIREEFSRGGALQKLALRYMHALLMQVSQTALCNRLHSLEQRLSRWLLMCRDRAGANEVRLTQEFLSIMLGVNRPTVSIAATTLQSAGYIKYSRGRITILDGPKLEKFTCECYSAVKKLWPPPAK